jgi:alcohol dehydrogenase (cytochrome c)
VAIGEGKVFIARRDARIEALDQKTGKLLWSTPAERWQEGFSITSAPLYFAGLVISGFNGGDAGLRGRVEAFDARSGKLRWRFYTVPAPGEIGSDTWPRNNDSWKRGGAAVWQTPAVDPELGLIYFSTGNAGANYHGAERVGDNLFTASIVALEAQTGKYRWHYQQVHHDIWDYDSANPVVLFDESRDGQVRKGLVEVSKTGFAYILDRVTGKPLVPIEERPVPQEPRQATAGTQPYPVGDAIVPQEIDIAPEGAWLDPATGQLPNHGRLFTPFWTQPVTLKPAGRGGANWPPSAYDPTNHLLYVCATDRMTSYSAAEELEDPRPNDLYAGGHMVATESNDSGIVAALDVRTNRLVWRQRWRESCFSGAVVTAGGLLFMGRTDGRLTALDGSDGHKVWQFMTDAGVNSTVTVLEWKKRPYVAVVAGGNTLAGGKRGDGVWMFSLEGTDQPIRTGAVSAVSVPPARSPSDAASAGSADPAQGAPVYKQACAACHGSTARGGIGEGPPLVKGQSESFIADTVLAGRGPMPTFKGVLSEEQIRDVAAYVARTLAAARE